MPLNQNKKDKNVVHLQNKVLFSGEKQWHLEFAGKWMELENTILSEVTKSQKEKQYVLTSKRILDIKQRITSL